MGSRFSLTVVMMLLPLLLAVVCPILGQVVYPRQQQQTHAHPQQQQQEQPHPCHPRSVMGHWFMCQEFYKCKCVDPAVYNDQGQGNCNKGVAATNQEERVWCYVSVSEAMWCPDALPSDKTEYAMSRIACIA